MGSLLSRKVLQAGALRRLTGRPQDVIIKEPVQILIYNTRETIITRAYVKGFVIHPIEYDLGLSRVWLDK